MFCDKLKKLRKAKCLTQRELAQLLGMKASTIGMYEQGRRNPSISELTSIASFFGVSTDYMLCNSQNDVAQVISELKNRLFCTDGLMFNGEELNDAEIKQLMDAIEVSAAVVLSKKGSSKTQ